MVNSPSIFLDYGELIFNYDFNKDTLLRAHKIALQHINSRNGRISLEQLSGVHNTSIKAYLESRIDDTEWPMERIMGLMFENLGLNGNISISDISDIYKLNDHDATPMPTTLETLPELAKMGKLGIISNLPHDSLIYELKENDLFDFFKTITVSYQVGYRKPHPAIYLEAMKRTHTTPSQSIFISHDEKEVDGARNVGMTSLLAKNLGEALQEVRIHQDENNLH